MDPKIPINTEELVQHQNFTGKKRNVRTHVVSNTRKLAMILTMKIVIAENDIDLVVKDV